MPTPITLLVDDACPLVHVYRYHLEHVHAELPRTRDGRPLADTVPNVFLESFCDVTEGYGVKGKLSIVPAPAALGDIVAGVKGDPGATRKWLDIAKRRLGGAFDFCPEGITHDLTVKLPSGELLDKGESVWSQTQDRGTLTPYLTRELRYLKEAGIDATGITSPWIFGMDVEAEYIAAILEAQKTVNARERSWYFLHMLEKHPSVRPWVAYRSAQLALVSIASTIDDVFWRTIDSPRRDRDWIMSLTDEIIGQDGKGGKVRGVLDAGGWPVLLTHWQSLFSNGLCTGLLVLEEVARRVRKLPEELGWASATELMEATLEAGTPRPAFLPPLTPEPM